MTHVKGQLKCSERRACGTLGQHRSTQRYVARVVCDDAALVLRMTELVRSHPRRGYRMICGRLRLDGWLVNHKRIYRIWQREGFGVPQKRRKKRRLGISENGIARRSARGVNDVWCMDFVHDSDERGRSLRWLTIVEEFTRECVALEVARSMTSDDVRDILVSMFKTRGVPKHIRSDNGPEFIARTMRSFLKLAGMDALYIEPGSPWQNGIAESFNGRFRDELLHADIFTNLNDARTLGAYWRNEYNHKRPHSSLGYLPPARFAATCAAAKLGAPPLQSAAAHVRSCN